MNTRASAAIVNDEEIYRLAREYILYNYAEIGEDGLPTPAAITVVNYPPNRQWAIDIYVNSPGYSVEP
jgi:hypothetical protein